jgi:hypothetical protein
MANYIDDVPISGIIRIRDMMYGVENPYRLDQGDVSFDAPDTVKRAMRRAIDENRSHYLQTTGGCSSCSPESCARRTGFRSRRPTRSWSPPAASTRCSSSARDCSKRATK